MSGSSISSSSSEVSSSLPTTSGKSISIVYIIKA